MLGESNKWNIFLGVLLLIIAVAALFVAVQSYQVAERSYELSYQSNLPVISTIKDIEYNWENFVFTEKITVCNVGGPLTNFGGYAYVIMKISFTDRDINTYIDLRGYFLDEEDSEDFQSLLLTTYSREGNYSDYLAIEEGFSEAASEDGYEPSVLSTRILRVYYNDYSGERWVQYFTVNYGGCDPLEADDAKEILDSAGEIEGLAESTGLSLYIWDLDGRELWEWYKTEILNSY